MCVGPVLIYLFRLGFGLRRTDYQGHHAVPAEEYDGCHPARALYEGIVHAYDSNPYISFSAGTVVSRSRR